MIYSQFKPQVLLFDIERFLLFWTLYIFHFQKQQKTKIKLSLFKLILINTLLNFKHNSQSNWGATYYRKKQKLNQDIMIYKKIPRDSYQCKKSSTFKNQFLHNLKMQKFGMKFVLWKYEFLLVFIFLKIIMDNMQHTILHTFKVEENLQKQIHV